MPGHKYMSECERRAQKASDRENERRLDRTRFAWFCIGAAFAVLMEIIIELAFKQAGV